MIIEVLELRISRFIKKQFPDGDTQAIVCALRDILQMTDQGRVYRKQILACYSKPRQAELQPEFEIACENILAQYQRRPQLSLFEEVGA
jgi:hypothetical protein